MHLPAPGEEITQVLYGRRSAIWDEAGEPAARPEGAASRCRSAPPGDSCHRAARWKAANAYLCTPFHVSSPDCQPMGVLVTDEEPGSIVTRGLRRASDRLHVEPRLVAM